MSSRRADGLLELAKQLAPAGFDWARDGFCIHCGGTVLYLGAQLPRLLGRRSADGAVGTKVAELFSVWDRSRVEAALGKAPADRETLPVSVALAGLAGDSRAGMLTMRHGVDASPPVDVLYVCTQGRVVSSDGESGATASSREGEHPGTEKPRPIVLICDDEARLGALTAGLLEEYGFVPVTVGTGDEALRVLALHDPPIDVLLLDVNLSAGRSARDVLEAMRDRGEDAKVILTSGLAEEDVDADLLTHPWVVGYVAKPYGVEELIDSISGALAQANGR